MLISKACGYSQGALVLVRGTSAVVGDACTVVLENFAIFAIIAGWQKDAKLNNALI